MKRSAILAVVATLVGFVGVSALHEIESQKELGRRPLGDTGLTLLVTQSRSIGTSIGIGDAKTWMSVVEQDGTWRQTQRIYVIGPESKQWASWNAPGRVKLRTESNFQLVDVPLRYESGRTVTHELVVGIAKIELAESSGDVTNPFHGYVPIYPGVEISKEISEAEKAKIIDFANRSELSISPGGRNSYCSIFFDRMPITGKEGDFDINCGSYISIRFSDEDGLDDAITTIERSKMYLHGLWVLPEGRVGKRSSQIE